jgi:hypothetical protein
VKLILLTGPLVICDVAPDAALSDLHLNFYSATDNDCFHVFLHPAIMGLRNLSLIMKLSVLVSYLAKAEKRALHSHVELVEAVV